MAANGGCDSGNVRSIGMVVRLDERVVSRSLYWIMRTFRRTLGDGALVRDVGALAAAAGVIGVSYGAIATASHVPAWAIVAMSCLVFAGGAQFLAVGVLAAGSPFAAVFGGLLLNARHLPFGMSVADLLATAGVRRLDELAERHPERDAEGPERLHAGVAGAGLQLGQGRLGDARAPGQLGQREPGAVALPPEGGRDGGQWRL